jgi:hypothetical protein
MVDDTHQCTRCQETKPLAEFRFIKARLGHRAHYHAKCNTCEAIASAERYKRNGQTWGSRKTDARAAARQREYAKKAEREGRVHLTRADIAATALLPEVQAERAERGRANVRAYYSTHREERLAYGRKHIVARREARLAEQLAISGIREYRCQSQQEFDDIRMSFAPWLRFKGGAMQYKARYEFDSEFRHQEMCRTAVRRTRRPDWTLQWTLRRVFKTIYERGCNWSATRTDSNRAPRIFAICTTPTH